MATTLSEKNRSDFSGILPLLEILKLVQKTDPEFPLQYLLCLIEISLDEGLSLTTLAERTSLSLSTISRIVGALSDFRQNGQPYQLIEIKISATERRRKELTLTPKGRAFLQKMSKVIENR
jgi:DNA-binding MarR family transcriptional regulator